MTLRHYVEKCLENEEFAYYWNKNNNELPQEEIEENFEDNVDNLLEVLGISTEEVIKNKGITATVNISTTVKFYEANNKCPVANFLDDIKDQKVKEKTVENIVKLATQGSAARDPLSKYVDNGIYELRTSSRVETRIFYFFIIGNNIILTNGYIKKSQNLDKVEFEKAMKYRNDYSRRH